MHKKSFNYNSKLFKEKWEGENRRPRNYCNNKSEIRKKMNNVNRHLNVEYE